MKPQPAYPKTRYEPKPLPDLGEQASRRFEAPALAAFFNILERWQIPDDLGRALIEVSKSKFYELKKAREGGLSRDQILRVSYLVGIYKALHILHAPKLADTWVLLPNANRLFRGRRPVDVMVEGGLPAMQAVRRLLDARRGGI